MFRFYSSKLSLKAINVLMLSALLLISGSAVNEWYKLNEYGRQRLVFKQKMQSHPFVRNNFKSGTKKEKRAGKMPTEANQQDYILTMDPATGKPETQKLLNIFKQVQQFNNNLAAPSGVPGSNTATTWVERGPNNVGGRTRAIMFDPNDATAKKVWAGGVTGGLWYNNDITLASSTWNEVDDFWANLTVTCIAHDPNNTQIFYVGTGESFTSASRGAGIWKTTNGGTSWTQLTSTSNFFYVNDIVVRNEGGNSVVYAAVDGDFYNGIFHGSAQAGLQRSTNGGTSWTQVLPNIPGATVNFVAADIEIAANNDLWVGTTRTPYGATDRGGGRVLKSTNGTTWTVSNTTTVVNGTGRVEVACAPNDANYVYAMIESDDMVEAIKRTTNGGTSWSNLSEPIDDDNGIPASDFSRDQAGYDLILAVHPTNRDQVIAGAINLHMTTNGGTSWSQISKWSNNPGMNGKPYSLVHADQHAIVSRPGFANSFVFGNDGGVYYSANITNAATTTAISERNTNYNVTQFYACAIGETAGQNLYLAGAQDNGTQRFTQAGMNATTEQFGGDGAFCFIDKNATNMSIVSYVYNNYYLYNGTSYQGQILNDDNTGYFINPADFDHNLNILYSSKDNGTIYRVTNATSISSALDQTITLTGVTDRATALKVSEYTTSSTTLFIGTASGDLYRIVNANTGTTKTTTNITGSSFPAASVSSIELGTNENEIVVAFKNYGVNSIWYTSNGGTSWTSKEGNLPDMPVRWVMINPLNTNEAIAATEVGVWGCNNFQSTSPTWTPSNTGLANVRVDQFRMRATDRQVVAATHGRGLFSSNAFATATPPVASFTVNSRAQCTGDTALFSATSAAATSYTWYFEGGSPQTSTLANPQVSYNATGKFDVKLVVSNNNGTDSITLSDYISVGNTEARLTINTDDYGSETSWKIIDSAGTTLYSGGGYADVSGGQTFIYDLCLPADECFFIRVYDVFGDGMCCQYGNGGFTITDLVTNQVLTTGGTFSDSITNSFCIAPRVTPSVRITTSDSILCAGQSTSLTATITNGTGTPSYQWSNGLGSGSTVSVSPQNTTTYSVTVTLGTTQLVDSITVQAFQPPTVFAGNDTTVFTNAVFALNAQVSGGSGSFGYSWQPGAFVSSANVPNPNTAPVTSNRTLNLFVSDVVSGCVSSDAMVITVVSPPPVIVLQVSADTICAGDTISLSVSASGGSGTFSYSWFTASGVVSGNNANATAVLTTSGYVGVSVTSGSQSVSDSVFVMVVAQPTVNAGADQNINAGTSTTLNAVAGAGFNYQWNPAAMVLSPNAQSTQTVALNQTTTFWVQAFEPILGCPSSVDSVTVFTNTISNPLTVTAVANQDSVCASDTVILSATTTGGTGTIAFTWNGPAGFSSSGSQAAITPNSSAWYSISATDGINTATDSVFIFVYPAFIVDAGANQNITTGASANLTGTVTPTGNYNYAWSPAAQVTNANQLSTSTTALNSSTWFYLEATNISAGCSASDSVLIAISGAPLQLSLSSTQDSICATASITLSAAASGGSGLYSYQWSNGMMGSNSSITVTPSASGFIGVTVSDGLVSTTDSVFIAVAPAFSVSLGNDTTVAPGTALNLTAQLTPAAVGTYVWSPVGSVVTSSGNTAQTVALQSNSSISALFTDNTYGCSAADTINITVANNSLSIAFVIGDSTICSGDTSSISALVSGGNGNYTYSWSGNNIIGNANLQQVSLQAVNTGFFVVTVSDGVLQSIDSVRILTRLPAAVLLGNDTTVANGSSLNLMANVIPQNINQLYSWTSSPALISTSGLSAVTANLTDTSSFIFSVLDAEYGCLSSDTITVNVLDQLVLISTTVDDTLCAGDTIKISLTATGGSGNYTFQAPSGFTHQGGQLYTAIANTSQNYGFSVNDGFSQATSSEAITVFSTPVISAGPDQNILIGQSATLSGTASGGSGNYLVQWQPANLVTSPNNLSTSTVALSTNTTFTLVVTDAVSGCEASDNITINAVTQIPLTVDLTADKSVLCGEGQVNFQSTINGGNGTFTAFIYSATDTFASKANIIAFISQSAMVYVWVSDGTQQAMDSVLITVIPDPEIQISPISDLCINASPIAINANPIGGSFSGAADANGMIDPLALGVGSHQAVYTIVNNSCTFADSVSFNVLQGVVGVIQSPDTFCVEQVSVNLSASPSGGIFFGNAVFNGNRFNPNAAGLGTHTLYYFIFDPSGCSDTAEQVVQVVSCAASGIENFNANNFEVYPNPAQNGQFILKSSAIVTQSFVLRLTDITGQEVFYAKYQANGTAEIQINAGNVAAGMYQLTVSSGEQVVIKKLMFR